MKFAVLHVVVGLLLAGCDARSMPSNVYTPDLVGLIDRLEEPGDPVDERVIVAGETVDIMNDGTPTSLGGTLSEGALFIYVEEGDDAWFFTTAVSEAGFAPGCYFIGSNTAFDQGDHVVIVVRAVAIRFPKVADYEAAYTPEPSTGRYPEWQNLWCLNERGELVRAD